MEPRPSMPQLRTIEARDADDHAGNLTNWEQRYDQTTPGLFQGMLVELQLPQMQVFRESTSQGVQQSCCVWPDAIWFGLPDHTQPTRINGRIADAHTILVRPGHREFELLTPPDYTIYGIVVRHEALRSAAEQQGYALDWARLASMETMAVNADARTHCLHTLSALLSPACTGLDSDTPHNVVLDALLSMLDTRGVDASISRSFLRRQRIVANARSYVLAHPDQAVTVPELCQHLFVSRRTLQYCFEDVLGINPMQYLRLIRLNGARRHLRETGSAGKTVRDVAADWGFWHFSQFSSDYRKLFGYCPSESRGQRVN